MIFVSSLRKCGRSKLLPVQKSSISNSNDHYIDPPSSLGLRRTLSFQGIQVTVRRRVKVLMDGSGTVPMDADMIHMITGDRSENCLVYELLDKFYD